MKVTIFGVGYVGLVQGAVLASVGHNVVCVDVDENKVEQLKLGIIPIFEPGLTTLVRDNYEAGLLSFTCDQEQAVNHADIIFIAVGTPPDEDGSANLKYVLNVASLVATHMKSNKIVINKSTVPVGTATRVLNTITKTLKQRNSDLAISVASNPEFLKEGSAVHDCTKPDRIIIGTEEQETEETLRRLYAPFNRNHDKVIVMDIRSAELTKYAANCMLASRISFMNEMANLAEALGADIEAVRHGIGSDPRIGYQFIYAGCGFGGSCFPKDIQALIQTSKELGYQPGLLNAIQSVNRKQKNKLFELILGHYNNDIKGKTFAIWGLSFKPNTDDMREAPSRTLMQALWEQGAKVVAYDPQAMEECQLIYGQREDFSLAGTKEMALKGADALVICTEWGQFKTLNKEMVQQSLSHPVIFDGRNLFDPIEMQESGFCYYGIGRGLSICESALSTRLSVSDAA